MKISKNLLNLIKTENITKKKFLDNNIKQGDLLKISYKTIESGKEKNQRYEAIVIGINNKGISKSITLRRHVQGISVEQIFALNSPNLIECKKYSHLDNKRSKLYFLRKKRKVIV